MRYCLLSAHVRAGRGMCTVCLPGRRRHLTRNLLMDKGRKGMKMLDWSVRGSNSTQKTSQRESAGGIKSLPNGPSPISITADFLTQFWKAEGQKLREKIFPSVALLSQSPPSTAAYSQFRAPSTRSRSKSHQKTPETNLYSLHPTEYTCINCLNWLTCYDGKLITTTRGDGDRRNTPLAKEDHGDYFGGGMGGWDWRKWVHELICSPPNLLPPTLR
jgi:hypothetical protein